MTLSGHDNYSRSRNDDRAKERSTFYNGHEMRANIKGTSLFLEGGGPKIKECGCVRESIDPLIWGGGERDQTTSD